MKRSFGCLLIILVLLAIIALIVTCFVLNLLTPSWAEPASAILSSLPLL